MEKKVHIPILLTLVRLVLSPVLLPVLIVYALPLNVFFLNAGLATLFVAFALTDFFDGYLARRFGMETALGKLLDPIADKFLVYSCLIALLAAERIFFAWVLILIGRELFVMGVRMVALEHGVAMPVSFLAKLKTAAHLCYIAFVILNPYHAQALWQSWWNVTEALLLALSVLLAVWSATQYVHLLGQRLLYISDEG